MSKPSGLATLDPRQGAAADPESHVWLGASAGTGKTQVLSARVLRLMLDGVSPEAILCATESHPGHIQHGQTIETPAHKSIDEPGLAPADVDHARILFEPRRFEHLQRHGRKGLEPTDLTLALGPINGVPVALHAHRLFPRPSTLLATCFAP